MATSHIDELNYEMTLTSLPVIVFIGLIAMLGIIGNLVVIYVYHQKYPACNFKYFVLFLAGIDLCSCVVLMPLEIVTLIYWFIFPSSVLCKMKSFLNAYTVTTSAATLLLIAIDRFRKVCRPHSKQIQPKMAVKLTAMVLLISLIPAASDAVFWGTHTDDTERHNGVRVTVIMCEKDDQFKHTVWPMLHTLVLYGATNVTVMFSTMVLYIIIAIKLFCAPSGPVLTVPSISVTTPLSMESDSCVTSGHRESIFSFPAGEVESGISESEDNTVDLSDSQGDATDDNVTNDVSETKSDDASTTGTDNNMNSDNDGHNDVVSDKNENKTTNEPDVKILQLQDVSLRRKQTPDPLSLATKKAVRMSSEVLREPLNYRDSAGNELVVPQTGYRKRSATGRQLQKSPKAPSSPGKSPVNPKLLRRRRSTVASLPGHTGTRLRRKTLIMFILTSVFVVTSVLYFTLIGHMSLAGNFVKAFTSAEMTVWMFFLRLYFVNSVINPLLYGFLDPRFRKALWNMGIHISWIAGSVRRNIAESIRRSSSSRNRHELTVMRPQARDTRIHWSDSELS